jgi:hypothetical protein
MDDVFDAISTPLFVDLKNIYKIIVSTSANKSMRA